MVDIPKHIEYWKTSSEEDFAAAQSLMEKGHFRQSLFFAHLALEKMLKAHVTSKTKDIPPRIHNLIRLAEIADILLDSEKVGFLRSFDIYQMEGRYPDSTQILIDSKIAKEKLDIAGEIIKWLKAQL